MADQTVPARLGATLDCITMTPLDERHRVFSFPGFFSFQGSAWERTTHEALPRVSELAQHDCIMIRQAEPERQWVPRQSLGTSELRWPRSIEAMAIGCTFFARTFSVVVFLCLLGSKLVSIANGGENWTQWRGPTADGIAGQNAKPPLKWDNKTNIKWVASLLGDGSATPIVWGNQVFLVSAERTSKKSPSPVINDERAKTTPDEFYYRFLVTCIDRETGKQRWQKTAVEQVPHEGRHETHTYAAGSPTTDGERLYVSFGSRGFYCYSMDGELIWQVDLGDMRTRLGWGEAVTPVLAGELLIINWDHEDGSFITALDRRTGTQVWKVNRPGEVTSWNTPLVTVYKGRSTVVVNGTNRVRAYDAQTGEPIWECGGQTTNAIPSPIRFEDNVICMSGYRAACANSIPLDSIGDITDKNAVKWSLDKGTPYVPSPVISGTRLFFTSGNSDVLSCVDVRSGKVLFDRRRLTSVGILYSSPIVANGHIFFTGREGTTVVLKDSDSIEVASVNQLQDATDASLVAVDNQLFVRSWTKLYCIEE